MSKNGRKVRNVGGSLAEARAVDKHSAKTEVLADRLPLGDVCDLCCGKK